MNPILKNILAVIAGWIGGSFINMGLVEAGHKVFPVEGLDPSDFEAMAAMFPSLEPKYFLFPFLAHALGTLVGAVIAARLAASHKTKMAMIVGLIFLLGGLLINYMITGPIWFTVADLVLAYLPMAWLGGMLGAGKEPSEYA